MPESSAAPSSALSEPDSGLSAEVSEQGESGKQRPAASANGIVAFLGAVAVSLCVAFLSAALQPASSYPVAEPAVAIVPSPAPVAAIITPAPAALLPVLVEPAPVPDENVEEAPVAVLGSLQDNPLKPVVRIAHVKQGTGMMATLLDADIPTEDAHAIIDAIEGHIDLRRIPAGQELKLTFPPAGLPAEESSLEAITLELSGERLLRATRMRNGGWDAKTRARVLHEREIYAKDNIKTSLFAAAEEAGLPRPVIAEFIRIYSHIVDFQRDIRKGDEFEVFFTQAHDQHGHVADTKPQLLYLLLSVQGKRLQLWRHEEPGSGIVDYFDAEGRSMKRLLMRTPIDGARLSSGFGMRKHPILGYSRMHQGLDFAAPRGTPIYASGNGVVTRIGRDGGYGKMIHLRHANGYETLYAHMSGFAKGLKRGARVEQGEIIGYVGSTGLSTGPHLHYEVHYRGKSMNPHSLDIPLGRVLEGEEMQGFQRERARLGARVARVSGPGTHVAQR